MKIGCSVGPVEAVDVADDDVGYGQSLRLRVCIDLFRTT